MENFTKQSNRYSAIHIKLSSCLQAGCILCTQSEKKVDKYVYKERTEYNNYAATFATNLPCEDIYLDLWH